MRVLVIGGTGFLGPHILKALQDHEITVLHRGKRQTVLPAGIRSLYGDRRELSNLTHNYDPDAVIDCICASAACAESVVDAFAEKSARIVMLSSADVYRAQEVLHGRDPGPLQPVPIREDGELRRYRYPYRGQKMPAYEWANDDYDKILAEQTLEPLHPTILRLPMIYGPGDPLHRFRTFLEQMDAGKPVVTIEEQLARWKGCWGYVENVAAAVARAVTDERAMGRTFNVAEPDSPDFLGWLELLGQAGGWKGEIRLTPEHDMPFQYDQDWTLDSTRIRHELGWQEHITRLEGLRRTIAWERSNVPVHAMAF